MIHFEKAEGSVGVIGLTMPDGIQAPEISSELGRLCSEIAWDEEIRVIVLTCSEWASGKDCGGPGQSGPFHIAEPIANLRKPVIAAITGHAVNVGLELALACDLRVACEESRFGLVQIREGLIPCDGGTQRLARLAGRSKALEMILTGELIGAAEAYRIGLLTRVVHADAVMGTAMDIARSTALKSPTALEYAKSAILDGMDLTIEQGLRFEADLYFLLQTTRDRTEGIEAFLEKRSPQFEGK